MICENSYMWLRIDERTDVLSSLSLTMNCVDRLKDDPALWKWAILSLHNALQGAMVCHLSGTAQLGALSDKSVKEWLDWHERDRRGEIKRIDDGVDELGLPKIKFARKEDYPPNDRLADAKELFARLYTEKKRCEGGAGAVIIVTQSECDSFRRLHDLRNEFSHFTPKGWSIELVGLPGIFIDIVGVLKKISSDPWPFRHMAAEERAKLEELLSQLDRKLQQLRESYSETS
jgi:hypothetical protein